MTASTLSQPATAPTSSNTKWHKPCQPRKPRPVNPRRLELIELSQTARALIKMNSDKLIGLEELNINNVIKHMFYPAGEYRLFNEWKADGLCVRKGEKGYPIWGRKRKMTKLPDNDNDEAKEYAMFPLAYIFHESQVEQRNDDAP